MESVKVEQERKYNILRNPAGDLLIIIRAHIDSQEVPSLVYDGGEHAMLCRNSGNAVILDYIHPMVRTPLLKAENVLIVEAQAGAIIREYFVPVKATEKLSLPIEIAAA